MADEGKNSKPEAQIDEVKSKAKKEMKKDDTPKPLKVKKQDPQTWDDPSLIVSTSPHVHNKESVGKVMWTVFIVLLPATIWGILHFTFGLRFNFETYEFSFKQELIKDGWLLTLIQSSSFLQIIASILSCMLAEVIMNKLRKQRISALDGSAAVTGLLLGMLLPPNAPLFISIISSFFAIIIVKQLFGGLGSNFLNPAAAGRVFAMSAWPAILYTQEYYLTKTSVDTQASATALEMMKNYIAGSSPGKIVQNPNQFYPLSDLFIGNIGGSIGEISAILLLLGGFYLYIKKYITWEIPITFLGTVFLITYLIGGKINFDLHFALYHLLSGGLILGALYMATDMVTCPLTSLGQIIFGVSCGLLTVLIRLYGGYPEGVVFSIVIMNLFVPLIDRVTMPRVFGHKERARAN